MQYMILIYGNEKAWSSMPKAEMDKSFAAFMEYNKQLAMSGVLKQGEQLHPSHTAKTVRMKNGAVVNTDGPFAESKEQLGGYYIVDVPSEKEALEWAAKCPAVYGGALEVRPVLPVNRNG
jgi:hypothetical protein